MKRYCRNCFHPLANKAKFCAHCGQKDSDGKVRMSTMLRKLWDTTFHLEGKFLRTCWQLFLPGKVTTEFFKGKQDRYPHPLRMFAIVMFFFLFMVNTILQDRHKDRSGPLGAATTQVQTDSGEVVVNEQVLPRYERMKYKTMLVDMRKDYETLPSNWKTPQARKVVDSLLLGFNRRNGLEPIGLLDSLETDADTTSIGFLGNQQMRIATLDYVRYDPDELIQRYNISDWKMQLMLRQTIKSYKNPDGLVHAYVGSLTWTILALVAMMSGVLSLLYWRQKRYYVEHFIFLLHFHTGVMLAALLGLIGLWLDWCSAYVFGWIWLGASIFMYRAMRRYYGQGRGKTLLKWFLFGVSYYFSFFILFLLGLLLVFAVY